MEFGEKRLGNWIVTKYDKDGVPFIRVSPVCGEYSWEYSSMDSRYISIESAMDRGDDRALVECFVMDSQILHNELGIFHLIYNRAMDIMYHISNQRAFRGSDNIVDAILESFESVKAKIDELYGGAIDPSEILEQDKEALNEMKAEYEFSEELKKE